MGNERGSVIIGLISFLAILYMLLFYVGCNGYGYMGYYGYRRGPSLWYLGGPRVYHTPHVRTGSIGGPKQRGGGFGGGK